MTLKSEKFSLFKARWTCEEESPSRKGTLQPNALSRVGRPREKKVAEKSVTLKSENFPFALGMEEVWGSTLSEGGNITTEGFLSSLVSARKKRSGGPERNHFPSKRQVCVVSILRKAGETLGSNGAFRVGCPLETQWRRKSVKLESEKFSLYKARMGDMWKTNRTEGATLGPNALSLSLSLFLSLSLSLALSS